MQDSETLVSYREAFPEELDCRRDFIDTFIECALEEYVGFLDRIRGLERIRTSRRPLTVFVKEIATGVVPGFNVRLPYCH